MERLTEKRDGKNVIPLRNAVCGVDMPKWKISRANALASFLYGDAADRLAAYEETGFSPEDLQFLSETVFSGVGEAAQTIDHWKRLSNAEADGRLLTLPCPIGTTVYIITAVVSRGYPDPIIENVIREEKFSYEHLGMSKRYLFLSYEEAESALRERQNA